MRKSKVYPKYTIKEKNKIVEEHLNGEIGRTNLLRKYQISSDSVIHLWVKQYRTHGTTVDNRGKSSKGKGRRKKIVPENMTREELIEYVNATEDIKKVMVCLEKQKKNIK